MMNSIPIFAVVGKVNAGKSSVLATLLEVDDAQLLRISATPGETTECQNFPVEFDGQELIRFIDTPGFSRPIDVMNEIKALVTEGDTPTASVLKAFCDRYRNKAEFEDERRLLEPLLAGAGLIYVIDPSKPLRDNFIAEMEILRWTGNPRLAILNCKGEAEDFLPEWKQTLGSYFNLVRTFNAHEARYDERRRLIQSLLDIDEANANTIRTVLSYLDQQWGQRREESVETVISFLEKSLTYRETSSLDERDLALESRRDRKLEAMGETYFSKITSYEHQMQKSLLKLYRHHLIKIEQGSSQFAGLDLFSEETWQKWGLSRTQLAMAGGATGAAGGVLVDIGTGGLTHGFGTLLGALGGAAAAFFKGGALPDIGVSLGGGLKIDSTDGRALQIGPPKNENFPWILLDSSLNYFLQIMSHTHAIREEKAFTHDGRSLSQSIPSSQRNTLAKWFKSCSKGSPDRSLEPEVFAILVETLQNVESD